MEVMKLLQDIYFVIKNFYRISENITNHTWLEKSRIYLSCHERDWVPNQRSIV